MQSAEAILDIYQKRGAKRPLVVCEDCHRIIHNGCHDGPAL